MSTWLENVEDELTHLRAVLEWSLTRAHDVGLGARLAAALEMFWWHGGAEAEGRNWIEAALSRIGGDAEPETSARLAQAHARLLSRMLFS